MQICQKVFCTDNIASEKWQIDLRALLFQLFYLKENGRQRPLAFNHLFNYIDLNQFSEVTYSVHVLFKGQHKVVSVPWYDVIQSSIRKNLKDAHLYCFQQSRREKTAILLQSISSVSTNLYQWCLQYFL